MIEFSLLLKIRNRIIFKCKMYILQQCNKIIAINFKNVLAADFLSLSQIAQSTGYGNLNVT